ncbi:MAG TPA: beta-ketoacyl-ACP synthase II [Gammaproteobacteria bacterium]|nr:beta-ketoacyl-ACP synthase II [Gammaproteobacteria bacterium]
MSKRRVVITGLGIVSPVGNSVDTAWSALIAGRSGIGPITRFDPAKFSTRIAGSVRDLDVSAYVSPKDARKMDPFIHYGMVAAGQAIDDSGIEVAEGNAHRIGVAIGSGIGGIDTIEHNYAKYLENGSPRKISPFFVPGSIINMISGHVSIRYGITGPNLALVTACTTGTHSIGIAARTIAYGDADVMVAGGAEMATTPLALGGFCSARALSTRNDDPEAASRPWDRERDGFVLSDGAGCVVLEEYEHARARGAGIYAELAGFGMSGDAHHITAPPESGEGARLCMVNALDDAGIAPRDVAYINAHGTSTDVGDKAETVAIKRAFGEHAAKLMVSSTKSMTGHLLGAAGGVEAIFCVLAIRDGIVPPTINYEFPDPECDLDYVPNEARNARIDVALSNSFGFGGTNGTLVFRALR